MEKETGGKLNNQGLTLLELLIAVIVLAIIVVPFLNSFVISARNNGRAAQIHRATSVAQNIVEGFKAGPLSDVIRQMNYPELGFSVIAPDSLKGNLKSSVQELTRQTGTGGDTYVKSLSPEDVVAAHPGKTGKELRALFLSYDGAGGGVRRSSVFSMDHGKNYEFIPQKDDDQTTIYPGEGEYYFSIQGIQMQGSAFDALIRVDAGKYRKTPGSPPDTKKYYNDEETVRLMGMDDTRDAVFVETPQMAENAIDGMKLKYPMQTTSGLGVSDLQRKITVTIEASGDAKPIHEVRINYLYTMLSDPTLTYGEDKEYRIFNNSETGEELRAVYIYYFPWYGPGTDEIEIHNGKDAGGHAVGKASLPVHLYVVKQERSMNAYDLQLKENSYQASLHIYDNGGFSKPIHTSLRTNLETNLYERYMPEGSHLPATKVRYQLNLDASLSEVTDPDGKKNGLNWEPGVAGSEAQDRIYQITVNIYKEGAAASHFQDKDKLTEIVAERND